ncbi:F-box/kelch-repeat protein-like protein isoform X1 [Tanacetum coccineum]
MPEVCLNIVEDILARSQVEDLLRCKSVCKSWKSLISSRRFVKYHLNYNLKKKAYNNESGDTAIEFDSEYCHRLVGSSNGLVCIHVCFKDELFVINPSTREVKKLRNPPKELLFDVLGFGYDSSIDDFKVVVGFSYKDSNDILFIVLELKSNYWKSVAGEVKGCPLLKYGDTYEGSSVAVLVHSLETPGENSHIKLSTISECNHNFDRRDSLRDLVVSHGMVMIIGHGGNSKSQWDVRRRS